MPERVQVEGLVEYTSSQIENLAEGFLRSRVDVPRRVPTDVEMLLEGTPDVQLRIIPALLVKHNVEGCVCSQSRSRLLTVFVDRRIGDGSDDARYNAVIAEELAHIQIHRVLIEQIKSVEDFIETRQCDQWQQIERDAELFSLAIRIPASTIYEECCKAYREVVSEHGFHDTSLTLRQVRNALANTYAVNYEDMNRRITRWPFGYLYDCITVSAIARSDEMLDAGAALAGLPAITKQQQLFSQ